MWQLIIWILLGVLFLAIGIIAILIIHGVFETINVTDPQDINTVSPITDPIITSYKPPRRMASAPWKVFAQPAVFPGSYFGKQVIVTDRFLAGKAANPARVIFLHTGDDTFFCNTLFLDEQDENPPESSVDSVVGEFVIDATNTVLACTTPTEVKLFRISYPCVKLTQMIRPRTNVLFICAKLTPISNRLFIVGTDYVIYVYMYDENTDIWSFDYRIENKTRPIHNIYVTEAVLTILFLDMTFDIYHDKQKISSVPTPTKTTTNVFLVCMNEHWIVQCDCKTRELYIYNPDGALVHQRDPHKDRLENEQFKHRIIAMDVTDSLLTVLYENNEFDIFHMFTKAIHPPLQQISTSPQISLEYNDIPAQNITLGKKCVYVHYPEAYTAVGMLLRYNI